MAFLPGDFHFMLCSFALSFLALVLGYWALSHEQFRLMNFAGLANSTSGAFSYFLEYNYWTPPRLGGLRIGMEDFLISYGVGLLAWLVVALLWRGKLQICLDWFLAFKRFLALAAVCYATYLIMVWVSINPMTALIVICMALAAFLIYLKPGNWPLALTGSLAFSVTWFAVCVIIFQLLPDFLLTWNLSGSWGWFLFGVPAGEIIWAAAFGAVLPLLTGYVFGVRICYK